MRHLPISESILGSHEGACWVWHLKRNISIAPSHMAIIFVALGVVSLLIGLGFYWVGASYVLPFSFVEIAALFIAYFYNAVHANDYEKLILDGNVIKIESKSGLKMTETQLVRSLTRVDILSHKNEIIHLRQGVRVVYFGKFVHANFRRLLAKKISEKLHLCQP